MKLKTQYVWMTDPNWRIISPGCVTIFKIPPNKYKENKGKPWRYLCKHFGVWRPFIRKDFESGS